MIYHRTIHLRDTDAAGVVYFTSLLSICHEAYEASLQAFNINLREFFQDPSTAIPVTHAEIDFSQPLFAGDRLEIALKAQILRENGFEIKYEIFRESNSVAQAKTRHVCINPKTRQKQALSETMLKWITAKNMV